MDKWENQTYRPEVFIEKDAMLNVFSGICAELDVPYMSCRGYTSQSELWASGRRMLNWIEQGYTPIVFHFGDHDPSGIDMSRDIQERLSIFAEQEIEVRRVALNMPQIRQFRPPPNPAKSTDARYKKYEKQHGKDSWELDAIRPAVMTQLVRDNIEDIRDDDAWQERIDLEKEYVQVLKDLSNDWEAAQKWVESRRKKKR